MNPDWMTHAACAGMDQDLWFPDTGCGNGRHWNQARAVCATCPVRLPCLTYALEAERGFSKKARAGMFGGLTPSERARIRHTPTAATTGGWWSGT